MKSWLEKNGIEMYSTHNEQKSVIAEIFIRTLENKIYKYLNSVSESVCFDKLDDVVNKYKIHIRTNIKILFEQHPNWSEEVFVIKRVLKILLREHMFLVIVIVHKLLERFMKTKCKKQIKKNLELKKNQEKRR